MAKKQRRSVGIVPIRNRIRAWRFALCSRGCPPTRQPRWQPRSRKQFGHTVGSNQIYMIKTKLNMSKQTKAVRRASSTSAKGKLTSAVMWVDAIKIAKQL